MSLNADQPVSPLGMSGVSKEWLWRLAFVLGVLLIDRTGQWVPVPGLRPETIADFYNWTGQSNSAQFANHGAIVRLSIFSLGVWPYIWAWVIWELVPGEIGQDRRRLYLRWSALLIASLQAFGVAHGLQSVPHLVATPGPMFLFTVTLTLVAGVMFLIWLGEQITKIGFCDGIWLLAAAGIVSGLPSSLEALAQLASQGVLQPKIVLMMAGIVIGLIALIVLVETARLQVATVRIHKDTDQPPADFELRIDHVTIIPAMVAHMILILPFSLMQLAGAETQTWLGMDWTYLVAGQPMYMAVYGVLILILTFLLTALKISPSAIVQQLGEDGREIAGVPPSKSKAVLDRVLTRWTAGVGVYLLVIALIPELLIAYLGLPVYVGGISLMIVTIVALDIMYRAGFRWGGGEHRLSHD